MEATPNDLRSSLGNIKDNVKQGVKQEFERSGWNDRYQAVQDRAREAAEVSEEFVKAHPFYTILGAATIGFVAGMLINRSNH